MRFGIYRTSQVMGWNQPWEGAENIRPATDEVLHIPGLWVIEVPGFAALLKMVDHNRIVLHNLEALDWWHENAFPEDVKYIVEIYDTMRE